MSATQLLRSFTPSWSHKCRPHLALIYADEKDLKHYSHDFHIVLIWITIGVARPFFWHRASVATHITHSDFYCYCSATWLCGLRTCESVCWVFIFTLFFSWTSECYVLFLIGCRSFVFHSVIFVVAVDKTNDIVATIFFFSSKITTRCIYARRECGFDECERVRVMSMISNVTGMENAPLHTTECDTRPTMKRVVYVSLKFCT